MENPRPRERRPRAAIAVTLATLVAGAGVVGGVAPAAADVQSLTIQDRTATWSCGASPLRAPAAMLQTVSFTVRNADGTVLTGTRPLHHGPYQADLTSLAPGWYKIDVACTYRDHIMFNTIVTEATGSFEITAPLAASSVLVTAAPARPLMGQQVTVTADVTAPGAVVGGAVQLTVAPTGEVVDAPVSDGRAVRQVTMPMHAGEVVVTATYPGSDTVAPSSGTLTLTVEAATPRLTLDAPTQAVAGAPITLSAEAEGDFGTPEGGVQLIAHRDGFAPVVVDTLLVDGRASGTFATGLPAGTWTVLAHYSGSGTQGRYRQVDSAEQTLVVTGVPVTLGLPESLGTPVGTPTALTVDLGPGERPATLSVSRGEVTTTVPVPADGPVTVRLPVLPPGTHTLTVTTPAGGNLLAGHGTVQLTVAGEPDRTGQTPDADLHVAGPLGPGSTVVVAAQGYTPDETVAFFLQPGNVLLGTVPADEGGGAVLQVQVPSDLAPGEYVVRATGGSSGSWGEARFTVAAPPAPPVPPAPPTLGDLDGPAPTPVSQPGGQQPGGQPTTVTASTATNGARAGALPRTGTDTTGLLGLGALLLAAGTALVTRRTRGA